MTMDFWVELMERVQELHDLTDMTIKDDGNKLIVSFCDEWGRDCYHATKNDYINATMHKLESALDLDIFGTGYKVAIVDDDDNRYYIARHEWEVYKE